MKLRVLLTDNQERTFHGACVVHRTGPAGELLVYGGDDGTHPAATIAPRAWREVQVVEHPPSGAVSRRWLARQRVLWEQPWTTRSP